jgi:protein gp37
MSSKSKIQWTEDTWNPLAGCSIVSPGCHNCYAMRSAYRLEAIGQEKYQGTTEKKNGKILWTGTIRLNEKALVAPLSKRRATMYFVNSMSDLFHDGVPDSFIATTFAVMETCHQHTFQVLTKRSERMRALLSHDAFPMLVRKAGYDILGASKYKERGPHWRMNQWLGVSVEDKTRAESRIPDLLNTPAALRFLSVEPMLEAIDLRPWLQTGLLHWVIVGGESGPGSRACDVSWVRDVVRHCREHNVKVFVKQMGARAVESLPQFPAPCAMRLFDKKGGDMDEWPEDLRVREFPT